MCVVRKRRDVMLEQLSVWRKNTPTLQLVNHPQVMEGLGDKWGADPGWDRANFPPFCNGGLPQVHAAFAAQVG